MSKRLIAPIAPADPKDWVEIKNRKHASYRRAQATSPFERPALHKMLFALNRYVTADVRCDFLHAALVPYSVRS